MSQVSDRFARAVAAVPPPGGWPVPRMSLAVIVTACLAWCALTPAVARNSAPSPTPALVKTTAVPTAAGPVIGFRNGAADWFLGIPYAAPPVDDLRWRPPVPPRKWSEPRDATAFGGWCMQVAPEGFSKPTLNEDCLYLNVVAPRDALLRKKKRAVMIWIHGGGARQGRSNDYDPTPLVEQGDVIFVSMNYRLNILGFLAHPALDGEGHAFANYGLMDQQFAMAWVRDNIAAFGGDPDNVTIIGESSGGANVFNHLASPPSATLFHRAIVESGSLWYGGFAPFYDGVPLDQAEKSGSEVAEILNCTDQADASCLRRAAVAALADAIRKVPTYSFGVVVDGAVMPRSTRDALSSGAFVHVPIINGTNHDEWTWVEGLNEARAGHVLAEGDMTKNLEGTYGKHAGGIVGSYPPSAFNGSAGAASARAVTDGLFVCPLLALNNVIAKYTNVWGFEFKDANAPYPFQKASFPYGAAHTLEMGYIFKNYTGAVGQLKGLSPDQVALSAEMVRYWTTFAKVGNPNASGARYWPALNERDAYLSLVPPRPTLAKSSDIAKEHRCGSVWPDPVAQP